MKIKELFRKNLNSILLILSIFFLDRVTKYYVLEFFQISGQHHLRLNSFLSINLLWNEGIAFGLLKFEDYIYYHSITIIILIVLLIVFKISYNSVGFKKISYLIIIGGGLGNVFDRLYYKSVIDFIDLNYENFHWFIFNVADIFITIGVIILLFSEFLKKND